MKRLMSRYEWLKEEIQSVPRKKFFLSEPVDKASIDSFEDENGLLPDDFKEFITGLGRLWMYRDCTLDEYHGRVLFPRFEGIRNDVSAFHIGSSTSAAYFLYRDKMVMEKGVVYYGDPFPTRKKAISFEAWLKQTCEKARKSFTKAEWKEILQPPKPFTEKEMAVVKAMELYKFRKVGVTPDGKVQIEIHNGSSLTLPRFAIGASWSKGCRGGVYAPTADLLPGETKMIEEFVYKGNADPYDLKLFRRPLPLPEERPYYLELQDVQEPEPKPTVAAVIEPEESESSRSSPDPGFGDWKFVHELTPRDFLAHPVWLWCIGLGLEDEEEGPAGGNETSMRPLLDSDEVPLEQIAPPMILLKIKDTPYY